KHMPSTAREIERFWTQVDRSGGHDACWPWMSATNGLGYGLWHEARRGVVPRRTIQAHRKAYLLTRGTVPVGMQLDHMCHTTACRVPAQVCPHRRCCNPAHLQPVTRRENVRRGNAQSAQAKAARAATRLHKRAAKTHCLHGHLMTPENSWKPPSFVNP